MMVRPAIRLVVAAVLLSLGVVAESSADDRPQPILPADNLPETLALDRAPLGLGAAPAPPKENPLDTARVELGRRLFFDPILSRDETVSCASCHQPDHGFASPDKRAIGIHGRRGERNSPTLLNRAFGTSMFWDGRLDTLEEQALEPIENGFELGFTIPEAIERLKKHDEYPELFAGAFPTHLREKSDAVTRERLAHALAAFQRVLLLGDSPVDRFHDGEYSALSDDARQGLWIFESRGGCWKCHSGPNFSDEEFHNTGVAYRNDGPDMGRFMATGKAEHESQFKTPTLRGLRFTAPFMHDGSFKDLREVVEFYNEGGTRNAPGLDDEIEPLELTDEQVGFIVAFLEALSPETPAEMIQALGEKSAAGGE